jgi:hypothetical protein
MRRKFAESIWASLPRLAVFVLVGAFLPTASFSVCSQPEPTLRCEFLNSSAVFVGTVYTMREEPQRSKEDISAEGWIYTLTVGRRFRGPSSKTIEVYTENTSARLPLDLGKQYLLFASKHHGRLEIVGCGNSALLSDASKSIQELEKIKIPEDALIEGRIGFGETPDAEGHKIRMVVIISGDGGTFRAVSGSDGWFHLHVPPGKYSATIQKLRDLTATPFDMSFDNPDHFVARKGHCSGLQFHVD